MSLYYKHNKFIATDELLINPHMGFTTFQRFNGDKLNTGLKWTEGFPIEYQDFNGCLKNESHPDTSMAYFRIYWKFLEPERGVYNWELIDRALETAQSRGQTLMLRIAPHGQELDANSVDVPGWYRALVGPEPNLPDDFWRTDPNNPLYADCFGKFIMELGKRYDGNPILDCIDFAVVGAWGEGGGSEKVSVGVMQSLFDAYLDAFVKTPLMALLASAEAVQYAKRKNRSVGWRADCLGDMSDNWCHMFAEYPQDIGRYGLHDAWKTAPVSFEVCWVVQHWMNMGWDIDYIIDQSLKWHITTFNAKSSPIPEEWMPNVERWLKRMGYRFALRFAGYPSEIRAGNNLPVRLWFENIGVAPIYYRYPLKLKLTDGIKTYEYESTSDITKWLPGDITFTENLSVPENAVPGEYKISLAILGREGDKPFIKLANGSRTADGWYEAGTVEIISSGN